METMLQGGISSKDRNDALLESYCIPLKFLSFVQIKERQRVSIGWARLSGSDDPDADVPR